MATSPLANAIVEALNYNTYGPSQTELDTTEDIHVGPLVFRFGGGSKMDRWYILEDPQLTPSEVQVIQQQEENRRRHRVCESLGGHLYIDDPENPDRMVCARDCGHSCRKSSAMASVPAPPASITVTAGTAHRDDIRVYLTANGYRYETTHSTRTASRFRVYPWDRESAVALNAWLEQLRLNAREGEVQL